MKYSGFMSGIFAISEWVMRFAVINLLWFILNLPIVFVVVSLLFAENVADLYFLLPILLVSLPFLFFPATQAMFASVRDWVMKRENKGLIKGYWGYYKENYKKSMIVGIILTIVWVVWYVDLYYFSMENILFMFVTGFLGILLAIYTINFFSVNAHYDMKLSGLLKNTLLITLGSPILSITVLFVTGILLLISINRYPVIIPFFTGSVIAFLSFAAFYRQYLKLHESK